MPELLETLASHALAKRQASQSHAAITAARSNKENEQGQLVSLNAGSSSLKFKVYDRTKLGGQGSVAKAWVLSGSIKIKDDKAVLKIGEDQEEQLSTPDLDDSDTLHNLIDRISTYGKITHIVHRIVHGASLPQCVSLTRSDSSALSTLTFLSSFAPLHNAISVSMIRALLSSSSLDESVVHLCCFDTTFHHAMPARSYRYLVDPKLAGSELPGGMEMRKWGFHGISYASILDTLSHRLKKNKEELNVIVCHLGSGSSICAVKGGQSFDTTMGLTPLEGLPGGTRSGSVDPVLALHISRSALTDDNGKRQDPFATVDLGQGIRVSKAEIMLNKQSGFKAICGTNDFQEVVERWKRGDEDAGMCFDVFVDKIVEVIGGYYFKMASTNALDAVVFSGGIGEGSTDLRKEIAQRLERTPLRVASPSTGFTASFQQAEEDQVTLLKRTELDLKHDTERGKGGVDWFVVKTDEEGEMANEVKRYMSW